MLDEKDFQGQIWFVQQAQAYYQTIIDVYENYQIIQLDI